VHDEILDPKLTFFTDEGDFNFSWYVNSQDNRYWGNENHHALIQLPLYDPKISVQWEISENRITGPIFYEETLAAQRYIDKIIHFSLIWRLQKKDSAILCKKARLHTQLRKLSEHYTVCLENSLGRIISKDL
jgi:hypothetical protein